MTTPPTSTSSQARSDPKATADARRPTIECCAGWPKQCPRIGTQFEQLAISFLAMLDLALIQRSLRITRFSDSA